MLHARHGVRLILYSGLGIVLGIVGWGHAFAAKEWPSEREALVKRQAELVERTLAQLMPSSSSRPQLYFLGFAGYGSEAVFKREVLAVRQLFDERFATNGRSVALINHLSTTEEIPLATVSNLDRVLGHIGRVMDTRQDTLFLFMTSHGEKGRLAVKMLGVATKQLTPARLKDMLDRSGIKRRVIIISSCHSGSFIAALASPTTLVMTAARADRSSFGCEDRRRWTYFGDAYFNRALRSETSFRKAFARAKRLITLWETRDRVGRSLPQIAGGEALTDID